MSLRVSSLSTHFIWAHFILVLFILAGCARAQAGPRDATDAQENFAALIPTGAGNERCAVPAKSTLRNARVTVRVMVTPDNRPQHVEVIKSSASGEGLEAAARECAKNYKYRAATNQAGKRLRRWTREFNISFWKVPEQPNQKAFLLGK